MFNLGGIKYLLILVFPPGVPEVNLFYFQTREEKPLLVVEAVVASETKIQSLKPLCIGKLMKSTCLSCLAMRKVILFPSDAL